MVYVIYAVHYKGDGRTDWEALYRTRDLARLRKRRRAYIRQWEASARSEPANGGIEVHVEWPERS